MVGNAPTHDLNMLSLDSKLHRANLVPTTIETPTFESNLISSCREKVNAQI